MASRTSAPFLGAILLIACGETTTPDRPDDGPDLPTGPSDFLSVGGGREDDSRGAEQPGAGAAPTDNSEGGEAPERELEVADIIRVDGDRLYLLNRWRGLQVVDLSEVDDPRVQGRVPVLGDPVEMLVTGDVAWVVASDVNTFRDATGRTERFQGSVVRAVDVSDPEQPELLGGIELQGTAAHTVRIGDVLYVLSRPEQQGSCGAPVESQATPLALSSIDAADPSLLWERDRLEWPEGAQAAHFGSSLLVLAAAVEGATTLQLVDLSDPGGLLQGAGDIDVAGQVGRDDQLDLAGTELRVLTAQDGSLRVEVWDVGEPSDPTRLGGAGLEAAGNLVQSLFAGDRLYALLAEPATLAVFDLADSRNPAVLAVHELPAGSDRVEVLGERLLSFGVGTTDGQSVALRLLDPTKGAEALVVSELLVGDGWSWMQGSWEDQAFQVLPEAALVLLPYSGLDPQQARPIHALQLVRLTDAGLLAGGRIEHTGAIRRARLYRERLLSFGDRQLQVIDATDPTAPVVTAERTLARDVRRLQVANGAAISQVGGSGYDAWNPATTQCDDCLAKDVEPAEFRIAPLADPEGEDVLYASFATALAGPVLFTHGAYAYVLGVGVELGASLDPGPRDHVLEIWDLSELTRPELVSRTAIEDLEGFYYDILRVYGEYGLRANAYAVGSTLVLFQPRRVVREPGFDDAEAAYEASRDAALQQHAGADGRLDESEQSGWRAAAETLEQAWEEERAALEQVLNPHRLVILDLSDPEVPRLAAIAGLPFEEDPFNFRVEGETLYLQHLEVLGVDGQGHGVSRYYVTAVGLGDPAHPGVTGPVNVPGQLLGAASDGRTLYTYDVEMNAGAGGTLNTLELHQGVAYLQVRSDLEGPVASLTVDGGIALGVIGASADQSGGPEGGEAVDPCGAASTALRLQTWDLRAPSEGPAAALTIEAGGGWVRALQAGHAFLDVDQGRALLVLDLSDPAAPRLAAHQRTPGWIEDITVVAGRAYLASGMYGVRTLELQ